MRPPLAKGLPLSSVTSADTDTNTMKVASFQSKQFRGAVQLRVFYQPVHAVFDDASEQPPTYNASHSQYPLRPNVQPESHQTL